jgi:8-oxo-dGTP diphosphatase
MERPKVGVGVLIIDGNKILLAKRKNAHGDGSWAPPGGHLEYGESWQQCVQREALEETGLLLEDIQFCAVTNDIFAENNKHYVTIFMRACYTGGAVQNREPEKCEAWQWFAVDQLPDNLFLPLAQLVEQKIPLIEL